MALANRIIPFLLMSIPLAAFGCSAAPAAVDEEVQSTQQAVWLQDWDVVPNARATAAPAVASWGSNHLSLFFRDANGRIGHTYRKEAILAGDPWKFSALEDLGGYSKEAPAAIAWPRDPAREKSSIFVFVRGGDDRIYLRRFDEFTMQWKDWTAIGPELTTSAVSVSSWGRGQLSVFYRGTNGALKHKWLQDDGSFSGEEDLGGGLIGAPAAHSWQVPAGTRGRIDVFVRGTGSKLHRRTYKPNVGWINYMDIDVNVTSAPSVSSWSNDQMLVYYRGTDGGLKSIWLNDIGQSNESFSTEHALGGYITSAPAAISMEYDVIDIFAVGGDNSTIYRKKWVREAPRVAVSLRDSGDDFIDHADLPAKLAKYGLGYVPGTFRPRKFSLEEFQTPRKIQPGGGCYVYSATALIEAAYKREYGMTLNLSERWGETVSRNEQIGSWPSVINAGGGAPWRGDMDTHIAYPAATFADPSLPWSQTGNGLGGKARSDFVYDCSSPGSSSDPSCMQFLFNRVLGSQAWRAHDGVMDSWTPGPLDIKNFSFLANIPAPEWALQESDAFTFSEHVVPWSYYDNAKYGPTKVFDVAAEQKDLAFIKQVLLNKHEVRTNICWDDGAIVGNEVRLNQGRDMAYPCSLGHVLILTGYDDDKQMFTAKNSAGVENLTYEFVKKTINGSTQFISAIRPPTSVVPPMRYYGRWLVKPGGSIGLQGSLVIRRVSNTVEWMGEFYSGGEGIETPVETAADGTFRRSRNKLDPRAGRTACLQQNPNDRARCFNDRPNYQAGIPVFGSVDDATGNATFILKAGTGQVRLSGNIGAAASGQTARGVFASQLEGTNYSLGGHTIERY